MEACCVKADYRLCNSSQSSFQMSVYFLKGNSNIFFYRLIDKNL